MFKVEDDKDHRTPYERMIDSVNIDRQSQIFENLGHNEVSGNLNNIFVEDVNEKRRGPKRNKITAVRLNGVEKSDAVVILLSKKKKDYLKVSLDGETLSHTGALVHLRK